MLGLFATCIQLTHLTHNERSLFLQLKAETAAAEQKTTENSTKNTHNPTGNKEQEITSAASSAPKTPVDKTDTPELTTTSSLDKDDDKDELDYREKGKTDIEVIKELRSQLKYVDHIIIFVYHHKIYVQTILVSKSNQMKFQGDFCRGYHFAP